MRITRTSLLAALLTVFALLTGCGKASPLDPENPVTIELWHYYNGPQKVAFDGLVEEFNNTVGVEQGIAVNNFSRGDVNELTQKVVDAANKVAGADNIPHIFAAYADTAYQIDQLGLIAELDGYFTEQELAEYLPEYLEEGRFDAARSLKLFPIAKSTEVLMLNRTDWDKFTLATGADLALLETIEGVTSAAESYYQWTDSLTPQPDDGKAFFGRDALANYFIIGCRQLGVEIFDPQGDGVRFNLDEAVLRRLWDHFYVPFVSGYFDAAGRFRSDDSKTGVIISFVGSSSGSAYFPSEVVTQSGAYPIETLILPPPRFEGGERVAVQQGAGMAVTRSDAAHEYASTLFLKWFTDVERNVAFSGGSGYLPVKKAACEWEQFNSILQQDAINLAPVTLQTLETSLRMIAQEGYTLYTPKVFKGGTQARAVLENSLLDCARQARGELGPLMDGGMSRAEAIAALNTDERFGLWLEGLRGELAAAQ